MEERNEAGTSVRRCSKTGSTPQPERLAGEPNTSGGDTPLFNSALRKPLKGFGGGRVAATERGRAHREESKWNVARGVSEHDTWER